MDAALIRSEERDGRTLLDGRQHSCVDGHCVKVMKGLPDEVLMQAVSETYTYLGVQHQLATKDEHAACPELTA